jgi:translation initiation factor 4B
LTSFRQTLVVLITYCPAKERTFGHATSEDSAKFDNPWRREGPLPDPPQSRDAPRRKFEGAPERLSSLSETANDWRSQRPLKTSEPDIPKRKGSGFPSAEGSATGKEDAWAIGSKFKPSANEDGPGSKFGSTRSKNEAASAAADDGDWRSAARSRPTRTNVSRTPISADICRLLAECSLADGSTPPTPQLGRRKLDLLPRSGNGSASPSPLSSPKMAPMPPTVPTVRANPFGAARYDAVQIKFPWLIV